MTTLDSWGRLCPAAGPRLLFLTGVGQGLVYDADGDFDAGGDGADGFPSLAAGEDGGALVIVDDGAPAADAAPAPGCFEAVLGLADDVAAPVFGQGEGQVEDQRPFGMLPGRDALQHLDADAALEQVAQHDQPLQEVLPSGPVHQAAGPRLLPRRGPGAAHRPADARRQVALASVDNQLSGR